MVPVTTPARLLESLPPRPPTPPRDSSDGSPSAAVLEDCSNRASMGSSDSARRFMMDTPPNDAPSSSAGTSGSTAGKARKRVEWSPWTNYYKAPVSDSARRHTTDGQLKVLPPSRERTCSKSILKPYDRFIPVVPSYPSNQPANTLSAHSYADFPAMLESVLQQLAGEARSARVDAYLLLSGALKYYDDIPDPRAIGEKMGLFMQFIRRDLNAETPGQTVLDTNLITQALKVLSIFIWTPQICESLADDFMVFVLDQAVTVLEKPSVPKVLVNNYMHLLGQQKFGPKIMSPERANRIITSLSRLDGHVKGNSILGERLVVYQRLLSQAKNVMAARAESWMDHLWSALQSGIREIRSRAISFGIQAGIELGATGHVTRVFEECFDRRHGQGTFAAHIQRHLAAMVAAKEEGSHAAQIWSVAILFLRSPPYQLEHWVHMKPWLLVIQKCFNSSDVMTKFQANTAWNRLIFAVGPDASTGQMMIKMLRQPMLGHMERKVVDKNSRTARQMALSSLCCLLYYAFRPSADFKQLSLYWDEYVAQVLGKSVLHSPADVDYGCAILACLFDASQSKPWNENRANEDGALQPEELPRLDPKWARANAQTICKTVETALSKANWSRTGDSETPVRKLWRTFMKAISDAATKEVKVSREHMEAMAQIMSLLGRIWRAGPIALSLDPEAADADADADFLDRFGFLVRTSVDALGGRCFTEKFLPRNGEDLSEALVTPTHSSPRTKSEKLHSPMLRLLHLFSEPPRDTLLTAPLFDMVRAMLESCCNAWGSSRTQMALLRECAEVLSPVTDNFPPSRGLYQIVAELASKAMELIVSDSARPTSELATHEFHDAVVILGQRCGLVYTELSNTWQALISTTIRASKILLGDDGIVDAVIQPLASMLSLQEFVDGENGILSNAACILSLAPFPDDEIIRDRPRRAPWGTASSLRKDRPNQFNFLHLMIDSILMSSYRDFSRLDKADLGLFLSALSHYITRCPPSKIGRLLGLVQLGVSSWVEDADHKLTAKDQSIWDVFVTVMNLWAAIATAVERLPSKDSATLEELEVLITSGLQSRRRVIVNRSIELWNSTFGAEEALEYPAKVRHAILPFKGLDSLLLPTFPVEADDEVADEGHSFVDASDGESGGAGINTFSSPAGVPATGLAAWADPVRLTASSPARRSLVKPHSPTRPNPRRNAKRKARAGKQKPRLRHDDSQIQFAPIESSPIHSSAADSQDLTDHQREVRQKQRAQAENMFPDLRSSPHRRSKGAKATLPQLLLSSDLPSTGAVASPSPPPAELSAPAAPPATTTVTATATATATATVTGSSILAALSKVLRDIRQVAFGGLARQEVRAIDDVMFDIRREAFQADTGGE
ncbi:MAG: hypothetical protein M1832_004189 [Thelocarpon impressellum]|nr:MAG: hypothetical protein M1832_004189 [Thelocarpon impressellum]